MAERWVISDLHLGHLNIIKYCNRPFSTTDEMDEFLLTAYNERVKPEDRVYHLGDLTMHRGKKWVDYLIDKIKQFNGHKILFPGNHDHFEAKNYLAAGFEDIRATWRDDNNVIFSHFPIHPGSMGSHLANVHGHTHDTPDEAPVIQQADNKTIVRPYLNVSVEKTDYAPIHMDEVLQRIRLIKENYDSKSDSIQNEG